ncbi:MAG: ParB/RepB/Spo0J family partition protein [Oscillospiraceae bacterium]|nr:ParB/RepB/Spo0J family partition protein [Oscillospiraceae bacterium]MBO7157475.1 ParB/RepB/Spo0J family partition protein [Clostridia bacterium]
MNEKYEINQLPLGALIPFKNHPFKVIENEELNTLAQSIRESGVLVPALARPAGNRYELISGHRRLAACKMLGLPTIPVIVRDLTDAEAIITMVDANLQREHILPSEKAFAYKMKMEAIKHQGQASRQVGTMSRTDQQIAKESKDSARQIQRYIRLTNLIPEILDMVDNKEIALTPAVELSYLTKWEQQTLYKIMQMECATPSLSQAQRMRRMSEERRLGEGNMEDIMAEIKGNQVDCIRITVDRFREHFKRDVSPMEMATTIDKALEYYQRYLERQRDER